MTHPAVLKFFRENARKGGHARAAKMTNKERAESARKAAQARWAKEKKKP
jgi:hypothetical protein